MRGAQGVAGPSPRSAGIIPADAGSTQLMDRPRTSDKDHPRRCGEHSNNQIKILYNGDHPRRCGEHEIRYSRPACSLGSSPQMRGAPNHGMPLSSCIRIIPADAGSTPMPAVPVTLTQDHPRRCGEHRSRPGIRPSVRGSSPQMRGALHPVYL